MTKFLDRLFIKDYDKPTLPEVRERFGVFSSILGVIVNIIIATAKLIIGMLVGSISITADAVNNFSDAGASIVYRCGKRICVAACKTALFFPWGVTYGYRRYTERR